MEMINTVYIVFLISVVVKGGYALMLTQSSTSLKLPYDFPVGATIYRLQPLDEKSGLAFIGKVHYHLLQSLAIPIKSKAGRELFNVDENTGSVMLVPHRKLSIAEFRGSVFALEIAAVCLDEPSEDPARVTVFIAVTEDNFAQPDCKPREEICFSNSGVVHYKVPENVHRGVFLGTLKPESYVRLCPDAVMKYAFETIDTSLTLTENGDLRTNQPFDHEDTSLHEWNVSCTISSNHETGVFGANLKLFVMDVDDNGPYIQNSTKTNLELDVSDIVPGKALPVQLTVLDADSPSVNKITVHLRDPLGIFHTRQPVTFRGVNGDHMLVNTALVPKVKFHFPDFSYNVTVTFNDTSLINKTKNDDIVFHVTIFNRTGSSPKKPVPPKELEVVANVFRHSSLHTRVVQPMDVQPHEGYFFRLARDSNPGVSATRIFDVTPATGIVFVQDEWALSRTTAKTFRLEVVWRNRDVTDRRCVVVVRVMGSGDSSSDCGVHQSSPCSVHGTAEACTSSCGRGASGGHCQWRSQASPTLVSEYATCSPDLLTCPDGRCDELERLDPLLCPQDCAGNVQGEAVPLASGKGVGKSAAPCTCAVPNTCVCIQSYTSQKVPKRMAVTESEDLLNIESQLLKPHETWNGCDFQCTTIIIAVSLVVIGLISIAVFLVFHQYKNTSKSDGFPSARTPLNSSGCHFGNDIQEHTLHQTLSRETSLEFSN
ncbi:hypothetical protein JTE90_004390 [Oedothorax gibbosus]|uniref:Cadherin domain-containing protein n=1 Tax=Oedothorax gibbosus TaxID=931172 RepID=A0AAV6UQ82_9ARAC|nr:hypothetical protein JTE90_004390 [Oedothorax gibbosus]